LPPPGRSRPERVFPPEIRVSATAPAHSCG